MTQLTQSNNSLASAIEFYTSIGFTLFPLNGKIPPKGFSWPKAEFNPFPSVSDFPSGNFGVKLTEEDLVIDIDPRNFPEVDGKKTDSLKLFQEGIGKFPKTFCVKTGSGGYHIYFKKPKDVAIMGTLREFPGIEFKTKGQYVVGLASIHPDTKKPYIGTPCPIANVFPELLTMVTRKPMATLDKGIETYVEDKQSRERYIEYLKKAPIAIEGEQGDKTTYSVAAVGHDFGLHPDITFELMLKYYNEHCQPPWEVEDLKKKVYNAYSYSQGALGAKSVTAVEFPKMDLETFYDNRSEYGRFFHKDKSGVVKRNQYNTTLFFSPSWPLGELVGFNQFSNNIEFLRPAPWHKSFEKTKSWSDGECLRCKHWLSREFKFEPPTTTMHEAAFVASSIHEFHPVKAYLESLKWDGHKRVHTWLTYFMGCEDTDYTRAVGLKFLVAAVKRIYEPGCKYDYMPVFEGKQGIGKSQALKILASEAWHADLAANIENKDFIQYMFGKWIIELSEMETERRAETQAMKSFLSRSVDLIRLPYMRTQQEFPRSSVFVGTFNPEKDKDIGWMRDTTGNRRYWPVEVGVIGPIELEKLRIARDQLWAEAYKLYKEGAKVYFEDAALIEYAEKEQEKRLSRDTWIDVIYEWTRREPGRSISIISAEEVFTKCIGGSISQFGLREHKRIAGCMQFLGWDKGVFWSKEEQRSIRGYRRPMIE